MLTTAYRPISYCSSISIRSGRQRTCSFTCALMPCYVSFSYFYLNIGCGYASARLGLTTQEFYTFLCLCRFVLTPFRGTFYTSIASYFGHNYYHFRLFYLDISNIFLYISFWMIIAETSKIRRYLDIIADLGSEETKCSLKGPSAERHKRVPISTKAAITKIQLGPFVKTSGRKIFTKSLKIYITKI